MKFFFTKAAKVKINQSTEAVLELETQKKRLEMERDSIQLELANQKTREGMRLEVEAHKHVLKLQEETAVFAREKKIWEKEKIELIDRAAREKAEFEKNLNAEFNLKTQEAVTLTKLESQQKIKQGELDHQRELSRVKMDHAEELSKTRSDAAETYYKKLTDAFQEIQLHGDKNSQFVQELALKVFDKVPANRTSVDVDVTSTPALQIEPAKTKKS